MIMRKLRLTVTCIICFFILLFLLTNNESKWKKDMKSKEFRVELKDRNISYFFSGYGEHGCGKSNILIATLSRPNAKNLRMGIRNSWGKGLPPTYAHKFFIGSVPNNETLTKALNEESIEYEDIVFTDLIDSYLNLTLKMNTLYQWQQFYCPDVEYFLRADEDTVLDVARFDYWLNKEFITISNEHNKLVIFGHVWRNSTVDRNPNSNWYISFDEFGPAQYPGFVKGASYFLTSKAINAILQEAKNYKHMPLDDVLYTGIVPEAIGIKLIDLKKHFANGNPLILANAKYECDENDTPYLFSVFDEAGEIELTPEGYNNTFKNLQNLHCLS